MSDLYRRSIEIILENQAPTGAYPASPTFPTYRYSWFRDGSFTAYAMDLADHSASARLFHQWAAETVASRDEVVGRAIDKAARGLPLGDEDVLHTRYHLDGEPAGGGEEWPNFQLDGFGTWLWAVAEHSDRVGAGVPPEWRDGVDLTARYLSSLWRRPCYDCWEELPDQIHPHTLAAVAAGLGAHQRLVGADHELDLAEIGKLLEEQAVRDGSFVKFLGSTEVDASLIGLATPYRVVEPDDPRMVATIGRIESELRRGGGLHRYRDDTFYGGGEWVLLTAWLAWYCLDLGEKGRAAELLSWVEAQADDYGHLPEQVPETLNDADYYQPWVERWGKEARPLLWSHAMYLVASRPVALT